MNLWYKNYPIFSHGEHAKRTIQSSFLSFWTTKISYQFFIPPNSQRCLLLTQVPFHEIKIQMEDRYFTLLIKSRWIEEDYVYVLIYGNVSSFRSLTKLNFWNQLTFGYGEFFRMSSLKIIGNVIMFIWQLETFSINIWIITNYFPSIHIFSFLRLWIKFHLWFL